MAKVEPLCRIGVLSDTHRNAVTTRLAIQQMHAEGPLDVLCFLGDCTADLPGIEQALAAIHSPAKLHAVRGNNDVFTSDLPDEEVLHICGKKLLLAHGHLLRVKIHRIALLVRAQEAGVDAVLFGHTHQSECAYIKGILLLNPGAASGARPTCAVLTIREGAFAPQILSLRPENG